MRVAVYSIAKNESQFVSRWAESAKDADVVVLADTGSGDDTVAIAESCGVLVEKISVNPWRFDTARNKALDLLPRDIDFCIALDLDEILLPGWREKLEVAHRAGWTRPRYSYTWSWNEDGSPGLVYGGDKIHSRHGYRWKHPVHEVLVTNEVQEIQGWVGLEIHHHPDSSKSRGQYLPLLAMSVEEDPENDRNAFYYARELFYHSAHQQAADEFKRHLGLPQATWAPERAASMRFLAKCEPQKAETWLLRACAEAPDRREPWVELAQHYYEKSKWEQCLSASLRALDIQDKPLEYLCEAHAWGDFPYDLAAISSYKLKMYEKAVEYGTHAVELSNEHRLESNLFYYKKALEERKTDDT